MCVCVSAGVSVCPCVYVCMCICLSVGVYMYACAHAYMHRSMYACMYACMYVCVSTGVLLKIFLSGLCLGVWGEEKHNFMWACCNLGSDVPSINDSSGMKSSVLSIECEKRCMISPG